MTNTAGSVFDPIIIQWIQFDAPVKEVEDLLYADFHLYEHKVTRTTNIACSGFALFYFIRIQGHFLT